MNDKYEYVEIIAFLTSTCVIDACMRNQQTTRDRVSWLVKKVRENLDQVRKAL